MIFSASQSVCLSVSLIMTLRSLPQRTVQNTKPRLHTASQWCCTNALGEVEANPSKERGWKLLFLIPMMLPASQKRGGRSGTNEAKAIYNRFHELHWKEFIQLRKPLRQSSEVKASNQRSLQRPFGS